MCVCVTQSSLLGGGEITPVQTEAYLKHQRLLWQFEANSFVFIDGSCDIERKAHSSNSSRPPPHSPSSRVRLRSSLLQTDALIDQLGEWPFYYPLENRTDFFFLLSGLRCLCCRQKDFSGFGCCFWRSPFWGDIPREAIMVHDGCDHPCWVEQLWEQLWLINRSFLEWSRRRAHTQSTESQIGFLRISNSTIQVYDFKHGIWSLFSAAQRTNRYPPKKFSGYRPVEKTNVLLSLNNPQPHSEQLLLFRPAYFPPAQPLPVLSQTTVRKAVLQGKRKSKLKLL